MAPATARGANFTPRQLNCFTKACACLNSGVPAGHNSNSAISIDEMRGPVLAEGDPGLVGLTYRVAQQCNDLQSHQPRANRSLAVIA